jgi:hypothetical protein
VGKATSPTPSNILPVMRSKITELLCNNYIIIWAVNIGLSFGDSTPIYYLPNYMGLCVSEGTRARPSLPRGIYKPVSWIRLESVSGEPLDPVLPSNREGVRCLLKKSNHGNN